MRHTFGLIYDNYLFEEGWPIPSLLHILVVGVVHSLHFWGENNRKWVGKQHEVFYSSEALQKKDWEVEAGHLVLQTW